MGQSSVKLVESLPRSQVHIPKHFSPPAQQGSDVDVPLWTLSPRGVLAMVGPSSRWVARQREGAGRPPWAIALSGDGAQGCSASHQQPQ
eukprot:scaffold26793_cov30-Tisochrysis_lutea.AAC.5